MRSGKIKIVAMLAVAALAATAMLIITPPARTELIGCSPKVKVVQGVSAGIYGLADAAEPAEHIGVSAIFTHSCTGVPGCQCKLYMYADLDCQFTSTGTHFHQGYAEDTDLRWSNYNDTGGITSVGGSFLVTQGPIYHVVGVTWARTTAHTAGVWTNHSLYCGNTLYDPWYVEGHSSGTLKSDNWWNYNNN
jgi:hypothetical protein